MQRKTAVEEVTCKRCRKRKNASEYWRSDSDVCKTTSGVIGVCKACIKETIEKLKANGKGEKMAIALACIEYGLYFYESIYDTAKKKDDVVSGYFSRVRARKGTAAEYVETLLLDIEVLRKTAEESTNSDTSKWGEGYTKSEYERLEQLRQERNTYISDKFGSQSVDSPAVQVANRNSCIHEVLGQRILLSTENDETKVAKLLEMAQKSISSMVEAAEEERRKEEQRKKSEIDDASFGLLVKIREGIGPIAEKNEYEDLQRVDEYYERFFIEPFKKSFSREEINDAS